MGRMRREGALNVVDWLFKTFGSLWGLDAEPEPKEKKEEQSAGALKKPKKQGR